LFYKRQYVAVINSTFVFYDAMNSNIIRQTCRVDDQNYFIGGVTDTAYGAVIPFVALVTCSILIISSLKKTRQRLGASQNTEAAQRREKRDYEFFKTILYLDITLNILHMGCKIYESNIFHFIKHPLCIVYTYRYYKIIN